MRDEGFQQVERALKSGGAAAVFDVLAGKFRDEKTYPRLFEVLVMKKRHELGLPLIQTGQFTDATADTEHRLQEGLIAAAREVGSLFLADGDIPGAWPYFRAIGESEPVAAAIEKETARDGIEPVIEIAFSEGVHPYKGFELALAHHGLCRAITLFGQYPGRKGREDCARLLIRTVHAELVESLKRTIAENEGEPVESRTISELVAGRDWLFGEYAYYIDTSHLVSVIRLSVELNDRETLGLAVDLTEYGKCLSHNFQYRGEPPFENICVDYGIYLRALLGEDNERAIAHFRHKLTDSSPSEVGSAPAEVLVGLLARLGRFQEAIAVSLEYFHEIDPAQLTCPSVFELCQLAGDFAQLKKLAHERDDLLNFTAAALQGQG